MKILTEMTHEQCENALNKLINYVLTFDREYREKDIHSEFEEGQHLSYYTILDTVRNQLETDNIKLSEDLEKICDDLLK